MPQFDEGRIGFGRSKPQLPEESTIDRIHRRARELWEQAGRPEGRENDYWPQAKQEILGEPK